MPDLASELLSVAEAEWALAVEDVALEHSLAMCLVLLQKRQRFCSKWRCCSACVSLLSFPSFEERLGLGFFWLVFVVDFPYISLYMHPIRPHLWSPIVKTSLLTTTSKKLCIYS